MWTGRAVCGRSLAGAEGSNPARGQGVSCEDCRVQAEVSPTVRPLVQRSPNVRALERDQVQQ